MIGNPLSLTLFNPGLGALLPELFHLPTRDFPAEGFAMTSSYPVNLRQVFYNYSGGTFARETLKVLINMRPESPEVKTFRV